MVYEHEGVFVKYALVYEKYSYNISDCGYVDLETGRCYKSFYLNDARVGEQYISLRDGLIPYTSLIETNKKNMTKRRILKRFNDSVKKFTNDKKNSENNNK